MQMLVLMLGSLVILALSFMLVLGWHIKDRAVAAAIIKAKSDLATCTEIIERTYPGPWQVRDGLLYKGEAQITNNMKFVDHLADLTGDTVTFFLGDTRVTTTVRGSNGDRAIGTKVSDAVAQTVLQNGQTYLGQANVVGQIYQTAYEPLRAEDGTILGIFYVGISRSYDQEMIVDSLFRMAVLGVMLTILIGLLAWLFVRKVIIKPLHEITLGTRDVATGHLTEKVEISGPREIGELAGAFNQMVERLESLAGEIGKVTQSAKSQNLNEIKNTGEAVAQVPGIIEDNAPDIEEAYSTHQLKPEVPQGAQEVPWQVKTLGILESGKCIGQEGLPKGLNQSTLKQIVQFIGETSGPFSAEVIADGVRLTRVTVRRYLEFLEQCGVLKAELKYGTVGRPVKLFSIPNNKI